MRFLRRSANLVPRSYALSLANADIAPDRPKGKSLKPLRALAPFLAPHWRILVVRPHARCSSRRSRSSRCRLRFATSSTRARRARRRDDQPLFRVFLAAAVVFGVFAALRFYLVTWLGERVVADVRTAVYAQRHPHGPDVLRGHAHRRSAVAADGRHDARAVDRRRRISITLALDDHAARLRSSMLVATSPMLTGMIVVLIPLIVGPLIMLGRRVRRLSRDSQDRIADTSALAGETLNAIQTVQAFTLEALQTRALSRGCRAFVRGGRPAQSRCERCYGARHDVRIRRDHVRAVDRRAPGARRHA